MSKKTNERKINKAKARRKKYIKAKHTGGVLIGKRKIDEIKRIEHKQLLLNTMSDQSANTQ